MEIDCTHYRLLQSDHIRPWKIISQHHIASGRNIKKIEIWCLHKIQGAFFNCNITTSHSSALCWQRELPKYHLVAFGLHFCQSTFISDYFPNCGHGNTWKYYIFLRRANFFYENHLCVSHWSGLIFQILWLELIIFSVNVGWFKNTANLPWFKTNSKPMTKAQSNQLWEIIKENLSNFLENRKKWFFSK